MFATLEESYRLAISLMSDVDIPFKWFGSWESVHQHLVDHLMVLFWRNVLPQPLLGDFFTRASVELRKHAIESLGRGLSEVGDDVGDVTLERVRELFEARLEVIRAATSDELHELDPFGWWLESPALDLQWKLQKLLALLEAGSRPEPDFRIYEFLPVAAEDEPRQAMQALRLLIDRSADPWSLSGNQEEIEQALAVALVSGDADAQRAASEIANRLGALGYRSFRTVVQEALRPNDR